MAAEKDCGMCFSPHWSASVRPEMILCAAAGGLYALIAVIRGDFGPDGWAVMALSAVVAAVRFVIAEYGRRHTLWRIDRNSIKAAGPGAEKIMRLDSLVFIECRYVSYYGIFGGVRVSIFSDGVRGVWISSVLSKEQAKRLMNFVRSASAGNCEAEEKLVPGRLSSLAHAVTSERTLFLMMVSAQLTVLAEEGGLINLIAPALLLSAVVNSILTAVYGCGMSFCLTRYGCEVALGIGGGRKLLIPKNAVAGVRVCCGPADVICGTGSMELVCRGGRTIPCLLRERCAKLKEYAMRLTDAGGESGAVLSDTDALRKEYAMGLIGSLSGGMIGALLVFSSDSLTVRMLAAAAVNILALAAVRCCTGMKCACQFGIRMSPAAVSATGEKA